MDGKALQIQHNPKLIRYGSLLQRLYFRPTFLGAENLIPERPAMYVGNHTIYGVFDTPILIDYLYTEHRIKIVSLADHMHFKVPYWRDMVHKMGAIEGIRDYARQAMQEGYSILVFPGGGREVVKRKGEAYKLIWKERYGFLKLAQEFGYDIAPFVAVGGDEIFNLALDANVLLEQRWFNKILNVPAIGKALRHGEVLPSVPKNLIPKRIPFYFNFLPRMPVHDLDNEEKLKEFRGKLQAEIYKQIQITQSLRDHGA